MALKEQTMTGKAAISLDRELLNKVESLASALQISSGMVFTLAINEFLERHDDAGVLASLDVIYGDGQDKQDATLLASHRRRQAERLDGQW